MLRIGSFVCILVAAVALHLAGAFAQGVDINATQRRFDDFYNSGRYAEALAEAEKLERSIKARFGAESAVYAEVLVAKGKAQWKLGNYREAEEIYRRAMAILEKAGPAGRNGYARALSSLAAVYDAQGRYSEAEREHRRALSILEAAVGANHPDIADTVRELAKVVAVQTRYAEAEELYKRAVAIREKGPGADPRKLGAVLSLLAGMYSRAGRAAEAEPQLKRALQILEKALPADHPDVAETVNELAFLYQNLGRYADAEPLFLRALAGFEKQGANHPQVALGLNNLANVYIRMGRFAEAEPLVKRGLAIREKQGADHPDVATSLLSLAVVYRNLGRAAEGEPLLKRALAIREKTVASDHPTYTTTLQALANVYVSMNRPADAEPIYARVLAIREKALGPTHPDVAATLDNMARVNLAANRVAESVKFSRNAVQVAIGTITKDFGSSSAIEVSVLRKYFDQNLAILHRAASARLPGVDAARESFEIAQWSNQSTAATALVQMAARFGAGNDALAIIARRQQDAAGERRALDRSMLAELAKARNQRDAKREEAIRQKMRELDTLIQQLNTRMAAEFPKYADLLSPKPLKPADVQKLIGPDEAVLLFHISELGSYVWAITRERADWREIALKPGEIDGAVRKLRAGLDPDQVAANDARDTTIFDLATAHELYRAVLGPVEDVTAGKPHLIVVPSGALTSLPYQVLVTEKPSKSASSVADYRSASWLMRKHALTVLPSVSSLKILRTASGRPAAPQAYLGFGDPVFDGSKRPPSPDPSRLALAAFGGLTRSASFDFDGLKKLRIAALPDTATELRSVARALGAPQGLKLGHEASERTVKSLKLEDYRILHFATHALKVDDEAAKLIGLREPALMLTVPAAPSADDDGLLTSSEIAALNLNADWVILSACNTAAGEKAGAEDLSGLTRAFFYAGARTMLVSHWAVFSDAAESLITKTVQALEKDRTLSPAEALRRSMIALIDNATAQGNAHPSHWAPFVIVGTSRVAN